MKLPHNGENFLVLFDFDETLIRNDSDIVVMETLALRYPERAISENVVADVQWTNRCSTLLSPFTREEIIEAIVASVYSLDDDVIKLIQRLDSRRITANNQEEIIDANVEIMVISDANTLFIEETFRNVFKVAPPSAIFSNQYHYDEASGKSSVEWFQSKGVNRCPSCSVRSPNMCKSFAVQQALNRTHLTDATIIYIGDGFNDSCPTRNVLRLRDHVFVRKGFGLERVLSTPKDNSKEHVRSWATSGCGVCHHNFWQTGAELLFLFEGVLLTGMPNATGRRLPPLATFNSESASPKEFRVARLAGDIPKMMRRLISSIEKISSCDQKFITHEQYNVGIARMRNFVDSLTSEDVAIWPTEIDVPTDNISKWDVLNDKRFLPPPQALINFGRHWRDLPWMHGEIYMYLLVWHLLYADVPSNEEIHRFSLDVPFAEERANPISHLWTVDGLRSCILPKQFPQAHGTDSILDFEYTSFPDYYQEEKDALIRNFFTSNIVPMVVNTYKAMDDHSNCESKLHKLLMSCVWGNAVDLGMYSNEELTARHHGSNCKTEEEIETVQEERLVANHLTEIVTYVQKVITPKYDSTISIIDIILDNCGVECCADMLFALFCVTLGKSAGTKVRLHTKQISYYVSDVMPKDIEKMLLVWEGRWLDKEPIEELRLSAIAFRACLADGTISIHSHPFWVSPSENADMPPSLVRQYFFEKIIYQSPNGPMETVVPKTSLVIFKGDLNFRRVCGDRHWTPEMFFKRTVKTHHDFTQTTLNEVLSRYWPYKFVPVVTLRTNKSEVSVGPSTDSIRALDTIDVSWRWSGSHAVALFAH